MDVFRIGIWANLPDITKNGARIADKKRGKLAIGIPGAGDGLLVDGAGGGVEKKRFGREWLVTQLVVTT